MSFLPIVGRELRTAARRRGTYWFRTVSALLASLAGAWLFLLSRDTAPQQWGMSLFAALAGVSFVPCWFAGVWLTADSVSQEWREGTLGLLFLTDLKGYDVVLGKLAASSFNAAYGLMAVVPVLGISLVFGGVTGHQLLAVAIALLSTLFFSLAAGMFFSTVTPGGLRAAMATAVFLVVTTAVLPWVVQRWTPAGALPLWDWMYFDPGYALWQLAGGQGQSAWWNGFGQSVLCVQSLSWLLLAWASRRAPRIWQDNPAGSPRLRLRAAWRRWVYGDALRQRAFRTRLLDINPFLWLAARDPGKPAYVWACLGLFGLGWWWGYRREPDLWRDTSTYLATVIVLHLLLRCWMGLVAGQQLAEDRRTAALELMLSTPLTAAEIFRGELRALARQFGGPALAVVAVDLLLCRASVRMAYSQRLEIALGYAGLIAIFLADAWTIAWLGQWRAVTARAAKLAAAGTLLRVLVWPWVILLSLITTYYLLGLDRRWYIELAGMRMMAGWFALSLLNDLVLASHAWYNLHTRFRQVVAEAASPGRTGLAAWLRGNAPLAPAPPRS